MLMHLLLRGYLFIVWISPVQTGTAPAPRAHAAAATNGRSRVCRRIRRLGPPDWIARPHRGCAPLAPSGNSPRLQSGEGAWIVCTCRHMSADTFLVYIAGPCARPIGKLANIGD